MLFVDIRYMFLVGGFSESPVLQLEMRKEFCHLLKIIIPQDVALTILKGSLYYCYINLHAAMKLHAINNFYLLFAKLRPFSVLTLLELGWVMGRNRNVLR